MPIPLAELPPNVVEALRRGSALEAIKLLRQATGLGLREAKYVVDAHVRGRPPAPPKAAAPAAPTAMHARQYTARRPGLSPGEVPRSGGAGWWFAALAVGALVSWYLLAAPEARAHDAHSAPEARA